MSMTVKRAFRMAHGAVRRQIRIHAAYGLRSGDWPWSTLDAANAVLIATATGLPEYPLPYHTWAGAVAREARMAAEWWLAETDWPTYVRVDGGHGYKFDTIRERARLAATEAA